MASQHRLATSPSWVSRWVGYRDKPQPKPSQYTIALWSFIGAFCGLSLVQAVFGQAKYFVDRGVPPIIASFGASTVLSYGAIEAPLAQPRALIAGQFISGLTGVCITKLFGLLHDPQRVEDLLWLAGSLSTATAIVLMQITETTHPPAGATALLAAVNKETRDLGYYLPVVLLSAMLILVVALITNNIQRRYPLFWFKPSVTVPALPSAALGGPEPGAEHTSSSPSTIGPSVASETIHKNTTDPSTMV